jgi:hypothetical protein
MISAPANSEPDFCGAMIRAKIDPRRELMLRTATRPRGKVKFDAIKNSAELQKLLPTFLETVSTA